MMELLHPPKKFTAFVLNYNLDVSAFVLVTVSTFPVWSSSIDCIPFLSTFLTTGHDPFFCSRILEFFLVSCFCLVVLRVICWRILFGVYAGVSYLNLLFRRMRSPGRDDSGEDDSYFESLDDDEAQL